MLMATAIILVSCESNQTPWNPVFEPTDFGYLQNSVTSALNQIDAAQADLNASGDAKGHEALAGARQTLINIKDYYIPLTTVRQIIYDAERYYHLKNTDKAEKNLKQARAIVEEMDQASDTDSFDKAMEQLMLRIDDCILSLNDKPEVAYQKFKELGTKANFMLIKGELVISGVKFH